MTVLCHNTYIYTRQSRNIHKITSVCVGENSELYVSGLMFVKLVCHGNVLALFGAHNLNNVRAMRFFPYSEASVNMFRSRAKTQM